jgi:hypothetical protein
MCGGLPPDRHPVQSELCSYEPSEEVQEALSIHHRRPLQADSTTRL